MRVAPATVQLALPDPVLGGHPVDRWWSLPEPTRGRVLRLLAVLIARGVLIEPEPPAATASTGSVVAEVVAGDE